MNSIGRNVVIWVILFVLALMAWNVYSGSGKDGRLQSLTYSTFLEEVDSGNVSDVTISGRNLVGTLRNNVRFRTYLARDDSLISRLEKGDVVIDVKPPDEGMSPLFAVLVNWFPMLLIIGIWFFLMRQMQSGGGRALGFGRSRAKLLSEKGERVTFQDVAGINEARYELEEVVEFLKNPKKFRRMGARIPKGVLLVGPPGTGKTLTARAVAGEANVPFFTISGSDFVEMFVGVGASRVRDMFEQGRKNAPCIIFVDELDAVGRHRGAGLGGGNDEREQTLNQLLVEMDGFDAVDGVILLAATNRPDVLDPALLRPGRFDRQIVVPNPDILGREQILRVHARKVPLARGVDLRVIARGTPGFSGADLANLINEGALRAARNNARQISMADLEAAKDKVMMGVERRSMVIAEEERKLTAYHEAGHAIATLYSPASDPIHKATIIPRGRALGMVMRLPERDQLSMPLDKLKANLVVGMGGRLAEEMAFGVEKVTTGAASDIKLITSLARRMVSEWGFSDKLGTVLLNENQEEVFLGHSVTRSQNVSEATAMIIDEEIRRVIDEATARCRDILTEHWDELVRVAEGLIEHETLSGEDISHLVAGGSIVRPPAGEDDGQNHPEAGHPTIPTTGGDIGSPDGPAQDSGSDRPQSGSRSGETPGLA